MANRRKSKPMKIITPTRPAIEFASVWMRDFICGNLFTVLRGLRILKVRNAFSPPPFILKKPRIEIITTKKSSEFQASFK